MIIKVKINPIVTEIPPIVNPIVIDSVSPQRIWGVTEGHP